jgi:hypothetical protein
MIFMNLKFAPRGVLQIDDARIIFPNFEGRPDKFTRAGDRSFHIVVDGGTVTYLNGQTEVVDAATMADILVNDVNREGAGWNVKIRPPRREDEEAFITMKIKVKFNDRGPAIYLDAGGDMPVELDEDTAGCLDNIEIVSVDLDVRPYDDNINDKPFRAAYLQSMHVTQRVNRFAARYANKVNTNTGEVEDEHLPF